MPLRGIHRNVILTSPLSFYRAEGTRIVLHITAKFRSLVNRAMVLFPFGVSRNRRYQYKDLVCLLLVEFIFDSHS